MLYLDLFNKVEKLGKEMQTIKGSEDAQPNELSLIGLTKKMSENYDVLLKEMNTKAEFISKEAMDGAKSYYDFKFSEEVERANNAYDVVGSASVAKTHAESLVDKVRIYSEKRLQEEKILLEKKSSTLKLWFGILGLVSIINLLMSAFMFFK